MKDIGEREFRQRLAEAFDGRRCVEAWLGYGDTLFVGLGRDASANGVGDHAGAGSGMGQPPYRLVTNLCEWQIEDATGVLGSSRDDPMAAEAASRLVGLTVANWDCDCPHARLRIRFNSGIELLFEPYGDFDWSGTTGIVWGVRGTDGYYAMMSRTGQAYLVHKNEPIS